jgi:hypothetical protein
VAALRARIDEVEQDATARIAEATARAEDAEAARRRSSPAR